MLTSKITKEWSGGCGKWQYLQSVAYIDADNRLQTLLLCGWSETEVHDKIAKLSEALREDGLYTDGLYI